MTITATMVKELRQRTGAGIMDAKNALTENDGDIEASIDWLRSKGMAKAAKKSSRDTAEGLVGVYIQNGKGAVVEVNSETDFVAKNVEFRKLVSLIRKEALGNSTVEGLLNSEVDGKTIRESITEKIASLGENITLGRVGSIEGTNIASYVHTSVEEGMGKIGVLVAYDGQESELGKQIAMHVAAAKPLALSADEMPQETIEREKQVLTQKALDTGKPESIVAKIVEGGIRKFLSEETLVNQKFVINPEFTVQQVAEKENLTIKGFLRYQVGEAKS
ncbi:MAG: elongation factor Ts [Rhodobacteraceae bacterium]|nr:elongation factor Ts [Paracoccaceae bacterium]MYF47062.1 elongation factor Ts [Paracoccaceae bacterium]MYI90700.1 elongation factor Ts [Paracoccaceae bacterium]